MTIQQYIHWHHTPDAQREGVWNRTKCSKSKHYPLQKIKHIQLISVSTFPQGQRPSVCPPRLWTPLAPWVKCPLLNVPKDYYALGNVRRPLVDGHAPRMATTMDPSPWFFITQWHDLVDFILHSGFYDLIIYSGSSDIDLYTWDPLQAGRGELGDFQLLDDWYSQSRGMDARHGRAQALCPLRTNGRMENTQTDGVLFG